MFTCSNDTSETFYLCVFLGLRKRKKIRCQQALLLLCLLPASCAHLMLTTHFWLWRMWPRLQRESFCTLPYSFFYVSSQNTCISFTACISRDERCLHGGLPLSDLVSCRCVEILISEQLRRYNEKMQNIQQLEYAEAVAVNQLKLRRQNTVREN